MWRPRCPLRRSAGVGGQDSGVEGCFTDSQLPTPDSRLTDIPLSFFDLETTGLDLREGHRVCEIALLRVRGGMVEDYLGTTVRPGRKLDPQAAAVNGFDDEELAAAAPFYAAAGRVAALARGAVLIAHNLPFDMAFLNAELAHIDQPSLIGPTLDTLTLARRLLRRQFYSLAALASDLKLTAPTHRALADVLSLRDLFTYLQAAMSERGIETLGDAMRLERGLLPGAPEPDAPPLIARALAEGRPLSIRYRSRSSPESITRTIRPIYLTSETNGTYLRAYCELRQDVRAFAINKIEEAELR
ncbi:WYL domain-containing protein [Chloroflexales bacterium ZM16-3]|nr:WYL domain-containing protein [Chloroflexales bacterium ZM16-3]